MDQNFKYLPEGKTLGDGKYRIIRFIAAGGFGCTYEAEFVKMRTRVAIKEFFVGAYCNRDSTGAVSVGASSQAEFVYRLEEKFQREAQCLFKLHHPNIVRVSDIFEENNTSYYVMDYIGGKSLKTVIREEGALSEKRATKYLRQIMDALEYVHRQNMLHLDIKPDNIMIDGDDNAILIDFGVSKQYDEQGEHNTSTIMGFSQGFAPIEQVGLSVRQFTPATDIYSLGATFYNALTGKVPPSSVDLISGAVSLDPMPEGISPSTRQAIDAMMQPRLRNRPQSIPEVRQLLDASTPNSICAGQGSMAAVDGSEEEATFVRDETMPDWYYGDTTTELDEEQEHSSKKWWWIAVALVLIAGIIAYFLLGDRGASDGAVIPDTTKTTVTIYDTVRNEVVVPVRNTAQANAAQQPQTEVATGESPVLQPTDEGEVSKPSSGQHKGHEWLDMGTSVKWATCNVDAASPHQNGAYFAWGEIDTKDVYTVDNCYTYGQELSNIAGMPAHDPAAILWGGGWRLPTRGEFQELVNKCVWTWDGAGYKVVASNGNELYLPAAGSKHGSSIGGVNTYGNYWSATPNGDTHAWSLTFGRNSHRLFNNDDRFRGFSVRPVLFN
ncbi:MAG: protein kinase [Muribaculaceae bacterium]|nr:protein kinase [Muribaculaceae bacterium]